MLQARSLDQHVTGESASAAMASAAGRSAPTAQRALSKFMKRTFDLTFGLVALLLLAPTFGLVALLVSLDGGPILTRHPRVGRGGQVFRCIKFRTMIDDAEASYSEYLIYNPIVECGQTFGRKPGFDPRVTAIGRALLSSGLDELPQLLNVMRGEMSVIGPRAEAPDAVQGRVTPPLAADIRPGLTDLRQLDFRCWFGPRERFTSNCPQGGAPKDHGVLTRVFHVLRRKDAR